MGRTEEDAKTKWEKTAKKSQEILRNAEKLDQQESWRITNEGVQVKWKDGRWVALDEMELRYLEVMLTMEKFEGIKGDVQACMADVPNPLRAEAERPEGNTGISITAGAGKTKRDKVDKLIRERPYVTPAPDPEDEEPAEMFQPEPELPFSEPEVPKNVQVKSELLMHSNKAGRRAFLQELKDLLVQASAEMRLGEDRLDDLYAAFGWAVARLIAAEDAAYREAEQ